jgi:hypothetical protein
LIFGARLLFQRKLVEAAEELLPSVDHFVARQSASKPALE